VLQVPQHTIDRLEVITGDRLTSLSEDDWTEIIRRKYVVFARTTPEHKLFIVEQCRKRGEAQLSRTAHWVQCR
jgi:magnesium-transporting ATPase (P-type)